MDEDHATTTLPATTTTWHKSHRLPLHNGGALPPVHELSKRLSYVPTLDHTAKDESK
jgi:hypothetical protein